MLSHRDFSPGEIPVWDFRGDIPLSQQGTAGTAPCWHQPGRASRALSFHSLPFSPFSIAKPTFCCPLRGAGSEGAFPASSLFSCSMIPSCSLSLRCSQALFDALLATQLFNPSIKNLLPSQPPLSSLSMDKPGWKWKFPGITALFLRRELIYPERQKMTECWDRNLVVLESAPGVFVGFCAHLWQVRCQDFPAAGRAGCGARGGLAGQGDKGTFPVLPQVLWLCPGSSVSIWKCLGVG